MEKATHIDSLTQEQCIVTENDDAHGDDLTVEYQGGRKRSHPKSDAARFVAVPKVGAVALSNEPAPEA